MAKHPIFRPTYPPPPQGECVIETPDGRVWSQGNQTRSNVYDNQDPFNLPSPNRVVKPQKPA